ncbi:NADPH-dependent F420 reductase [Methylobacterium sp. A52T]
MKIGILGVGHIGKSLALKLSAAGHDVKVANARGPETIEPELLSTGARAVTTTEAMADVEVLILSVPFHRLAGLAPKMAGLSDETVLVDTSNYYPLRDGRVEAIDAGQVEGIWVSEQLNRPVVKAWNAIGSGSLARRGQRPGTLGRIAIPVAGDRERDRQVAMALVEDTGFDAVDAGTLAESWRQQPGAPAYCTDLTNDEVPAALAAAERSRLTKRRDLVISVISERMGDTTTNPHEDWVVQLARVIQI